MLQSTVELLRERGYSGTGLREVIERSGAPRGSIYHHFPGGKAQLAEECVRGVGAFMAAAIEPAMRANDPVAALRAFVRAYGSHLEASDFRFGCPVGAAANELAEEAPGVAAAAAEAFGAWEEAISASLRRAGVAPARARRLAALVVASIEGVTIMCRARRDRKPLDDVGRELEAVLAAALPEAAG
jgi:AcrR family transcriptional regulator